MRISVLFALLVVAACGVHAGTPISVGEGAVFSVPGLGPCDDVASGPVHLPRDKPVVVLVHGCNASAGRFRSLARVFEFHGQAALCYAYDDRARLSVSAKGLGRAVETLGGELGGRELVVLGHSQGGLVSRLALSDPSFRAAGPVRLVTVSAPFNGIRAAKDCGARWLHVLSLGATVGVCRMATGAKWNEIHPKAWPVLHPGLLGSDVREHLRIVTDERNTCRRKDDLSGACREDDFVFSLGEQQNPRMVDARLHEVEVAAGHAEIVGNDALEPLKLIRVLQEHSVMSATPDAREPALAELLRTLF